MRCLTGDGMKLYQPCWCGDNDNYGKTIFVTQDEME